MRLNPTSLFSSISSDSFYLTVNQEPKSVYMVMGLYSPVVNTKYLPQTVEIIKKSCPSVLKTMCFNEDNLPFSEEVKKTEIGHLFEHILLEYLCLEKLSGGFEKVVHNGNTNWNWVEDMEGTFHITVDSSLNDLPFFTKALEKTIQVVEKVLQSSCLLSPQLQVASGSYL